MQGTNKIADEAKRIGEEAHEQAKKVGQEYETSAQAGFEAASRSFSDANRGFQMIAAEMTEYSKKTLEDVLSCLGATRQGQIVQRCGRHSDTLCPKSL